MNHITPEELEALRQQRYGDTYAFKTDFSTWDRKVLEKFARESVDKLSTVQKELLELKKLL